MNEVEKIFDILGDWYKLPKYQLERRIDIFFVLYLPEILKKRYNIDIDYSNIIPEFPIRKNEGYSSTNADYVVLYEKNNNLRMLFIELKTDMKSVKDQQINYYNQVKEKSIKTILEDVEKIKNHSKQKRKYNYLLDKLNYYRDKCIEDNDEEDIKVSYILPKYTNKLECIDDMITFEDIIEVLEQKNDEFSKQFCNLLSDVMLNN